MKYDKRHMAVYEKLGALQFQKMVFWLEEVKYWVMDKFFPNAFDIYSKNIDKKMKRMLEKCNDEIERKRIVDYFRYEKLKFKREINKKENRNYHIDLNHPTEFVEHLNNNKRIHVKGLIGNGIAISATIILGIAFGNPAPLFLYLFLGYEIFSAIINFQCINLQNYNLCRFEDERMKRLLKKMEEKKNEEYSKKIGEGAKVIGKAFKHTDDVPSLGEVRAQITKKEEVVQLLEYAKGQLHMMKNDKDYEETTTNRERVKIR